MNTLTNIKKAATAWLHPDHPGKKEAVEKTIQQGLFSREDVDHQVAVLKENIEAGEIEEWAKRAGLNEKQNAKARRVLCLHAGNLPLVGFQTVVGGILSGADYYGKLSRKDPYLLASFLDEVEKAGLDQQIQFSTNLEDFENLEAGAVVFAGSSSSVPEVKEVIRRLNAARTDAEYIIRTAKFSMAYLKEWSAQTSNQLAEAMLRYGGQGCRSVAIVVAPFDLEEVRDSLASAMQNFWKRNPPHAQPSEELKYQYAYNEAIQRDQLWMEHFLIQKSEGLPETDFTVHWVKGDADKVKELREKFGKLVQSVYTMDTDTAIEGLETETLELAQRPPLWWKPDGVDVVEQLWSRSSRL
ncbi:acyl-CoA reductase [Gracilimonas mengyeensis]|uniref:Acyl-CoA reductase (LuxC) n=1 Tax=Gracilimonas mengyeensis TaxID=1302730 RepID=A0A521C6S2_9BACT|nr:acyl-CoA reductase [Gracilimonas mengyeensis]SMO55065.1 Acyl-CoA reductase (LuxC) [Gracilimonas mengyeensis]